MESGLYKHTGIITESLIGIVERVTYHNPANGWTVLRVSPFDQTNRKETVIVHQTKVFAGATMEFRGIWTMHPTHGRQFKAIGFHMVTPTSKEGIRRFLASGVIRGVGDVMADRIVQCFGDQALEVIGNEPERLLEIPGIGDNFGS